MEGYDETVCMEEERKKIQQILKEYCGQICLLYMIPSATNPMPNVLGRGFGDGD